MNKDNSLRTIQIPNKKGRRWLWFLKKEKRGRSSSGLRWRASICFMRALSCQIGGSRITWRRKECHRMYSKFRTGLPSTGTMWQWFIFDIFVLYGRNSKTFTRQHFFLFFRLFINSHLRFKQAQVWTRFRITMCHEQTLQPMRDFLRILPVFSHWCITKEHARTNSSLGEVALLWLAWFFSIFEFYCCIEWYPVVECWKKWWLRNSI